MSIPLTQYWRLLATYLRPQRGKVTVLALLLFLNIGLQLWPPQIMRQFIDAATTGGTLTTLTNLALLVIALVLVQQLCSVLAAYLGEDVAWTATNQLRVDLAAHCLHLDLAFHNAHTPGEMIERIDGDVTTLANFFSQFVLLLLGNFLLLVGVVGLLFQIDWRVGLVGAGLVLVMFLCLARLRNIGIAYSAAHRQSNADLYGYLEERLGGLEEISANGAKAYVLQRFYGLLRHVWHKSLWENGMVAIPHALLIALSALGLGVMLAICADLFARQVLTIGAIYLVFTYTMLINAPINVITQQMEQLQRAGGSIVRLQELQATGSRLQGGRVAEAQGSKEAGIGVSGQANCGGGGALAVAVDQVTFGYTTDQPVLCDLSFWLRPGVKLGVLGRTGSGKTSLARLLLRLYDPDQGTIHLGDPPVDLRHLPLSEVRQRVGLVTQHVQLFHATLRDNLTFWQPTFDDDQLVQTLNGLGLESWLQSLPAGLDTMLAADGSGLSAGEAQLVAFARIFLRNPGLVILDEASSRLDPASEQRLEAAIDRLLAGRSAIIIAHRLSTLQRVDEILILDQGRIVEQGGRVSLAQDPNSRFAALLQTGLTEVLA